MKKIVVLSILVITLFSVKLYSQQGLPFFLERKNSIDLTVFGTGIFSSVNYNRIVFIEKNYFINASVGIGITPFIGGTNYPHQVSINFGTRRNFLEFGLGGNYWLGKTNASGYTVTAYSYNFMPTIGYRAHFANHLIFRVYAMPIIHMGGEIMFEDYPIFPYGGISLGYSF